MPSDGDDVCSSGYSGRVRVRSTGAIDPTTDIRPAWVTCDPQIILCPELDSVGYRTDANIVFDIFLGTAHREAGIAHGERVHARKWITSTVAEGTSSLPVVSGMHGFAAYRPRHERI